MSKDNVKKMFEKIQKDGELQKKYSELMLAHGKETENALVEKLVELGRTSGLDFGRKDLLEARSELMDRKNDGRELSDNDLAKVAGGYNNPKSDAVLISVFSFGVICGAISALTEIEKAGSCAAGLSIKEC